MKSDRRANALLRNTSAFKVPRAHDTSRRPLTAKPLSVFATRHLELTFISKSSMFDRALVHRLLEDFDVVHNTFSGALISHDTSDELRRNLAACFGADFLGLSSVDGVRKRYTPEQITPSGFTAPALRQDLNAGLAEVRRSIAAFSDVKKKPYISGLVVAGSSLIRLYASFQSANLLIRLGYLYESSAVLRLILEQIAWSYAVHTMTEMDEALKVSPTRSVSKVKNCLPWAGRLYGRLSDYAHVAPKLTPEFLEHAEGDVRVTLINPDAQDELVKVFTLLVDGFGTMSEFVYRSHVAPTIYWERDEDGDWRLLNDRPVSAILDRRFRPPF